MVTGLGMHFPPTERSWAPSAATASVDQRPATTERQLAVAGQWKRGDGDIEFINGAVDGDTAWLAMIERAHVVFDDELGDQRKLPAGSFVSDVVV